MFAPLLFDDRGKESVGGGIQAVTRNPKELLTDFFAALTKAHGVDFDLEGLVGQVLEAFERKGGSRGTVLVKLYQEGKKPAAVVKLFWRRQKDAFGENAFGIIVDYVVSKRLKDQKFRRYELKAKKGIEEVVMFADLQLLRRFLKAKGLPVDKLDFVMDYWNGFAIVVDTELKVNVLFENLRLPTSINRNPIKSPLSFEEFFRSLTGKSPRECAPEQIVAEVVARKLAGVI